MNKSYLKQMLTYINKVYHIGEKINTLKDKRVKSPTKISTITFVQKRFLSKKFESVLLMGHVSSITET